MSEHSRIGGTLIAPLMNEDSFGRTAYDVYARIVLGVRAPPNVYMKRGLAKENDVREMYLAETGAELLPHPGVVHWGECFAASVDDLRIRTGTRGPVDYKTASERSIRKWKNGPLTSYVWQLRLYMAVFEAPEADLFVAFGKDVLDENTGDFVAFNVTETRLFTVTRDDALERRMIDVGVAFWHDHVLPQKPPAGPVMAPAERLENPHLTEAEKAILLRLQQP